MKNLINIITILSISFTTGFASNNPMKLISSDDIEVIAVESLEIFVSAEFNAETENLAFTTTKDMSVVQIFNSAGTLEFQLPVMTNNVQINKNLFSVGSYRLGFILEGQSEVHFTNVTIK